MDIQTAPERAPSGSLFNDYPDFGKIRALGNQRFMRIADNFVVRDFCCPREGSGSIFTSGKNAGEKRGRAWEKNVHKNSRWLRRHDAKNFSDLRHAGEPAYIVGAGPSLARNVHELKNVRRGIIIAQNASAQMIPFPDYYFAIDYEGREGWWRGVDFSRTTGIFNVLSTPRLHELAFRDVRYFLPSEDDPFCAKAAREFPSLEHLDSGFHTTYSALHFATLLGCDPIIFVGCDYAMTGGEIHAGEKDSSDERIPVEDIFGNPTYSKRIYLLALLALSSALFFVSQKRRVINATEGGLLSDALFSDFLRRNGASALLGARRFPRIEIACLKNVVAQFNNTSQKNASEQSLTK